MTEPLEMPHVALQRYVNPEGEILADGTPEDQFFLACWATAVQLVQAHCGLSGYERLPEAIKTRAVLECGAELYHRRSAPSGLQSQFLGMEGNSVRLARDPMTGAKTLLAPYISGGFA